jgi:hypothetical protein
LMKYYNDMAVTKLELKVAKMTGLWWGMKSRFSLVKVFIHFIVLTYCQNLLKIYSVKTSE